MKHMLNKYKTLLKVAVNSSLLTSRFTLLVDFDNYLPFTSSNYAPNIIRDPRHDQYKVTYVHYTSSLLPSPRTRDGFVPFLFDRCLNHCINVKLAPFNLTLIQRFTRPVNLRFVSYFDRKQQIFRTVVARIEKECETRCLEYNDHVMKEKGSNIELSVPIVEGRRKNQRKQNNLTSISLKSTNQPIISITFKLKISFFQQIINLGSILGLWFGFSAVSLARMGRLRDKQITLKDLLFLQQRITILKTRYNTR